MCATTAYGFERCKCIYIRGYVEYCLHYVQNYPAVHEKSYFAKLLTPERQGLDIRLHNIDMVSPDIDMRKAPKGLECSNIPEVLIPSPFGATCLFCEDPEGRKINDAELAKQAAEEGAKEDSEIIEMTALDAEQASASSNSSSEDTGVVSVTHSQ